MSDKNPTPTSDDTEFDLLGDFDPQHLEEIARQQAVLEQKSYAARGGSDLQFPSINPGSAQQAEQARRMQQLDAQLANASQDSSPFADSLFAGAGLLGNLRQQAEAKQRAEARDARARDVVSVRLDYPLRQIFSYLNELVQLLNELLPPIKKEFSLGTSAALSNMNWKQGFCDYRSRMEDHGEMFMAVSFSYTMMGKEPLRVERESSQIRKFHETLHEYQLKFTSQEFRNERHYVERAIFTVEPTLPVYADWIADYEQGALRLRTVNLGRLGVNDYLIQPVAVTEPLLEQFSKLVLGEPNRFPSMVRAQNALVKF